MLTYEEVLTKLLSWIDRAVSVTIVPDFDGAMQVAGMGGVLRRGSAPPEWLTTAAGQSDEVLFFFVGDDEDWKRRWFVLARGNFVRAFTYPSLTGEEMLVVSQRLVNVAITLLQQP